MKVQTTNDIHTAFEHPVTSFKVDKIHPTKTELQEVCCKMEANAIGVACVEPECFDFGWYTLISKESEWKSYYANLQTQGNK